MPWFAIDTDLEGNDKFHAFIERRGWSKDRGLAFFYRFWRTVRRHAPRGVVSRWTDAYLGGQVGLLRSSGIITDLVACGFIDRVRSEVGNDSNLGEDVLIVHEWLDRNGKWIKDTRWSKLGGETTPANNPNDLRGNVRPKKEDCPPQKGGLSAPPRAPAPARAEQEQSSTDKTHTPLPPSPPNSGVRPAEAGITTTPPAVSRAQVLAFAQAYPKRDGHRAIEREMIAALTRVPALNADDLVWSAGHYARQCQREHLEPRFIPRPPNWLADDRFLLHFTDDPPGDPSAAQR